MAQPEVRPVPSRRKTNVDMSTKTRLVESFAGFVKVVTPERQELARECSTIQPRQCPLRVRALRNDPTVEQGSFAS